MEKFKEQIKRDMIEAMKAKEAIRLTTIRSITNAITVAEKNGSGKEVNHIDVLTTMAKQRRQSIEAFESAGNSLLADTEKIELEIIESYLPKEMSDAEMESAIDTIIAGRQLTLKDMGSVMNSFKTQYPGQNGQKISMIIKSKLV